MNAKKCFSFLQPASLVENVGQSWNTIEASSLLARWCQCNVVEQVQLRLRVVAGLEVEQQVVLDGKHGVVGNILVVTGVQLGYQGLVTLGRDHEMDVCRAERVTVHDPE
jgi:hypothetical protein